MSNAADAVTATTVREARRILQQSSDKSGISKSFFERVVELMGANPNESRALAKRWRLFAELGDEPAYAIRARAVGERLAGKWKAAGESFLEASRMLSDPIEEATFATGAIDSFARAGQIDRALTLAKRLARVFEKHNRADLAGRVRLNLGNALLHRDRYKEAAKQYEAAARELQSTGQAWEAGAALLGQSGAELYGGDANKAAQAAKSAADLFEEQGNTHFADQARLNLAHAHLIQGRGDESLSLLLELAPRLAGSAADEARCEEFLGDAYFRLNHYEAAYEAYSNALKSKTLRSMPLNAATCTYCLGTTAAALGRKQEALTLLMKSVRLLRNLGNEAWAGAALVAASELMPASRAGKASRLGIQLLDRSKSRFHLCRALLQHGELYNDMQSIERANRLISKFGFGFMRWRVHAARARKETSERSLRHWRRMFEDLMQERLLTRSTASRAAFLRDKQNALSEYLGVLLAGNPPRVEEALDVLSQSRSAALIDELLALEHPSVTEEARQALDELRIAVAAEAEAKPGDGTRRAPTAASAYASLQRKWLSTAFAKTTFAESQVGKLQRDVLTYVDTSRGLFAIHGGRALRLPETGAQVASKLRWLEFDLLSPMVGSDFWVDVEDGLAELRAVLVDPLRLTDTPSGVVPDGNLWSAPWSLLMGDEVAVLSNPVFASNAETRVNVNDRVVVWAYDPGDLPNVQAEVEEVCRRFPKAHVVSTVKEARDSLCDPIGLLHVASHASSRLYNPMYSSLELSDGPLLATEIARCGGKCKLVVLSACDTGKVSTRHRMEPDGLVRSFLALGAETVIASQWQLDDKASRITMSGIYSELMKGKSARSALTHGKKICKEQMSHPYYWAPLAAFGGYKKRIEK